MVVSVISPLKVTRYKAKKIFKEDYIEIFIDCPLTELINRDTKGLYKLAINKKIKNLIGYNSKIKYEKTRFKKIVVNTKNKNINFSNNKIIQDLNKKNSMSKFSWKNKTAIYIGRFQPFHDGHKAMFLKALKKMDKYVY